MECSLPGSSVHGISQARVLAWVATSFSRGSSRLRDQTHVSCAGRQIPYPWVAWEAPVSLSVSVHNLWDPGSHLLTLWIFFLGCSSLGGSFSLPWVVLCGSWPPQEASRQYRNAGAEVPGAPNFPHIPTGLDSCSGCLEKSLFSQRTLTGEKKKKKETHVICSE